MNALSFFAVGAGAAVGAWARWGLGLMLNGLFPTFPLGTLAANWLGGLLMGIMLGVIQAIEEISPALRLLITTGFLGGLTTFSAFSTETVILLQRQEYGWAGILISAHVVGSVSMTLLGYSLARMVLRT